MSDHLTPEQLEAPGAFAEHVQGCAQCGEAVRLAAGRRKLLGGVKPYTLAGVAFSRVEARLMEHVRENPPGPRWTLGRVLAFATLAAVAVLFGVTTVRPLFDAQTAEQPVAVAAAVFEPLTVVHASGDVKVKAGDVLQKGAAVDASGGRVVVATADGVSLRMSGGAKFVLGSGDALARLAGGTLNVDVKRRGPWVLWTGSSWVRTSDATFDFAPDQLRVYRGSVELADSATFANARRVNAPAVVTLQSGATAALTGGSTLGATAPPPWARLELGLLASDVELDGQSVGSSPLSLLTTPGKHKLRALVGEVWREGEVELSVSGPGLVTLAEPKAASPIPRVGPVVEADPEAIAAAVKAQRPMLRVCHEKWLKVNESARGKVMMIVTVSPKGRVTRASFSADEGVPETVNECLGRAVRAMKLPASSEEVEVEIPVVLGAQ